MSFYLICSMKRKRHLQTILDPFRAGFKAPLDFFDDRFVSKEARHEISSVLVDVPGNIAGCLWDLSTGKSGPGVFLSLLRYGEVEIKQ